MKKTISVFAMLFLAFSLFASPPKTQTVKFKTSAICGMCKKTIERNLYLEKGVKSAELDLKTKEVTINYLAKKTDVYKLKKSISMSGYDADEVVADQKAHDKLPGCCQKGTKEHKD
jgi:copper chaperone CopZ